MVKKEQGNERSVGGGKEGETRGGVRKGWLEEEKEDSGKRKGREWKGKVQSRGGIYERKWKGPGVLRKVELGEGEDKSERREGGRFEEGKRA